MSPDRGSNRPWPFILLLCLGLFALGPARAATLTAIEVAPLNPTIDVGETQAFTATGIFDDETLEVLGAHVVSVASGGAHNCAVLVDGTLLCWGFNDLGQLGDHPDPVSATPVPIGGITTATMAAVHISHSCALLSNGEIWCWGGNGSGQLGDGTTTSSTAPVQVAGLPSAIAVAAGDEHSCAVLEGGEVRCWGGNPTGQLGNGTTVSSTVPVVVSDITDATAIMAGYGYSCALLSTGEIRCWGRNTTGQLGNGTNTLSTTPVSVTGITNAVAVALGVEHSCAALASGEGRCWGSNTNGRLGTGVPGSSLTPVAVSGITNAIGISVGAQHGCALLASGEARCWGNNPFGQLGNGTNTQSSVPVPVVGITTATTIGGGNFHNCVLLESKVVQCWGSSVGGQLGNGTLISSNAPVMVSGLTPEVFWSSQESDVATVNATGVATGASVGSSLIVASVGEISGSSLLTVEMPSYSLSIIIMGTGFGNVIGAGTYPIGETATVAAIADPGSTFTGWTGVNGAECATGSVLLDADKVCTANFMLNPPPQVATTVLPDGTQGVAYSQALAAIEGTPPFAWSLIGGSLPPGLNLSGEGVISGMPAEPGVFSFTVQVTDAASQTGSQLLSISIIAPTAPLVVATTALPAGTVGVGYSYALSAINGEPPYTWTVVSGSPPPGVNLSGAGLLFGTPGSTGLYSFTVQVTDSLMETATQALSLQVNSASPPATAVELESFTAEVSGGRVVLRWRTGSEIGNAGFRVLRSVSDDEPGASIHGESLIPAKGDIASGAAYELVDADPALAGGATYYYTLVDIETTGTQTLHGPLGVTLVDGHVAEYTPPLPIAVQQPMRVTAPGGFGSADWSWFLLAMTALAIAAYRGRRNRALRR